MGAARKMQSEIERTLKKVQEGIEEFDIIWKKVYDTENANQKEKYEGDLKKEIKKLQRYRDQIKTWCANSDIKDKKNLLDARKQIEREMERFKVCEKETKTKAFSKEGLGLAAKLDPKDKAKMEMRDWLNDTVDKLGTEIETFEYDMEGLQEKGKKGKPPPRLAHLEESVRRHQEHVRRLEQMLRLLDNETISPDDVSDVKDLVDDYMDRNQDDFDDFEDPDALYESLLEVLDNATAADAVQPAAAPQVVQEKKDNKKTDKDKEKEREVEREAERKRERDRQAAAALKNQVRGAPPAAPPAVDADAKRAAAAKEAAAAKAAADAVKQQQQAVVREQQQNVAGATAAAVAAMPPPSAGPMMAAPQAGNAAPAQQRPVIPVASRPDQAMPAAQAMAADMMGNRGMFAGVAAGGAGGGAAAGTAASGAAPPGMAGPAARGQSNWMFAGGEQGFPQLGQQRGRAEILPDQKKRYLSRYEQVQQQNIGMIDPATGQLKVPQGMETESLKPPGSGVMEGAGNGIPGKSELTDAGMMGAAGPLLGLSGMNANQQLLSACAARSIPQPGDATWSSTAPRPRMPQGVTVPASYPTTKLPIMDNPALFEKLDSEALFFAFYHQPGSYQQYLAARELKRQSWRYHKVHGAWFQRHEEPTAITDEYEQGTYVYFDYNIMHDDMQSGWCYRLKQDFTFEYDALEDELII